MPDVIGFRGFCFTKERVGSLDAVITPPYDVIAPADRVRLTKQSAYSMAHVILPEAQHGATPYETAARLLNSWVEAGAMRQDNEPSFYLLEQTFADPIRGVERTRRAFLGAARLPEAGERTILGHERTFENTFEDRLRLMEATGAQFGPVFGLYADPEGALQPFLSRGMKREADLEARTLDGVCLRVWRAAYDPSVADFLRDKRVYIADGHHRFRTACAYRDALRAQTGRARPHPSDYVLMGFVSLSDPGLFIGPAHRLASVPGGVDLGALAPWFDTVAMGEDLPETLPKTPGCAIGLALHGGGRFLLRLRDVDRAAFLGADHGPAWRDLDVAVLHRGIVERALGWPATTTFAYERDAGTALAAVARGDFSVGFLLKPTPAEQIRACAETGEPMPHKSTYFFPKLPTGAAIRVLEAESASFDARNA